MVDKGPGTDVLVGEGQESAGAQAVAGGQPAGQQALGAAGLEHHLPEGFDLFGCDEYLEAEFTGVARAREEQGRPICQADNPGPWRFRVIVPFEGEIGEALENGLRRYNQF